MTPAQAMVTAAFSADEFARPHRDWLSAATRGFKQSCPACGKGSLYERYLKVRPACPECGEALHHHRADDAPPYFTIFIVGHIVIGLVLALEKAYHPDDWVHYALWLPLTLILSLTLLPRIKGALIGLQWAFYMHGFDPGTGDDEQAPAATAMPRT